MSDQPQWRLPNSCAILIGQKLLLIAAITVFMLPILVDSSSSSTNSDYSRNDLKNEQPEEWPMESFMSELVPLKSDIASESSESSSSSSGGGSGSGSQQRTSVNNSTVHEREFNSPQARIQNECLKDKTVIRVNFTRPFSGIIGAGNLGTTKCKINGDRVNNIFKLEILHNETSCDTQWDGSTNSILNNLFVRFHPSLETGSDLVINIMCRLSVGDLIVGRRPARRTQNLKQKLKSVAQKKEITTN